MSIYLRDTTLVPRHMNIHAYQAKEILRASGIPVPPGEVATTPDEAVAIAELPKSPLSRGAITYTENR